MGRAHEAGSQAATPRARWRVLEGARASGPREITCRWKAAPGSVKDLRKQVPSAAREGEAQADPERVAEAGLLDGGTAEATQALRGDLLTREAAEGHEASEVELGALRAAEQAAAGQHPFGTVLPFERRASRARLKLGGRRQTTSHLRWRCCKASRTTAWESSGSLGARAEGRLQKSVRGIFPALSAAPARVARTGWGSTERPLLVTGEPERAGRQGCGVSERLPNSDRMRAWRGSDVEHRTDGRRPGPTSRPALNRRVGIGSWRDGPGRDRAQA
jgi:hypothetical protein